VSTILQLIYSVIIGIIQGISEWLPISSKTQIIVSSSYLLNLSFQQAYTFGLFMEIGTIIASARGQAFPSHRESVEVLLNPNGDLVLPYALDDPI